MATRSSLQEHPSRVNACPQLPLLQTAHGPADASDDGDGEQQREQQQQQQQPWLLCAQRNEVDVWQLADAGRQGQLGPPAEGMLVAPSAAPEHLLRLVVQSGRHVSAACISQDGRWLAYSDCQRISCPPTCPPPATWHSAQAALSWWPAAATAPCG